MKKLGLQKVKDGNQQFLRAWYVPGIMLNVQNTNAFPHFSSNDSTCRWGTWVFDRVTTCLRTHTLKPVSQNAGVQVFCVFPFWWGTETVDLSCSEKIQIQTQTRSLQSILSYVKSLAHVSEGAWSQRSTVWRLKTNSWTYSRSRLALLRHHKGMYDSRQSLPKNPSFLSDLFPLPTTGHPSLSVLPTSREKFSPQLFPQVRLLLILHVTEGEIWAT